MTEEKRQIEVCPQCRSQLKAIINNKIVCLTSNCDYIYREGKEFRLEDRTIAELMKDYK